MSRGFEFESVKCIVSVFIKRVIKSVVISFGYMRATRGTLSITLASCMLLAGTASWRGPCPPSRRLSGSTFRTLVSGSRRTGARGGGRRWKTHTMWSWWLTALIPTPSSRCKTVGSLKSVALPSYKFPRCLLPKSAQSCNHNPNTSSPKCAIMQS